MRIQTCISSSSRQLLVFFVAYVASCARIFVPLRQSKVNYVKHVLLLSGANQKVVRLYVSVQKPALMHKFYPLEHLDGKHKHSLQGELVAAILAQIFQTWTQQVHYEHVPVADNPKEVHLRNSNLPIKHLIQLRFVIELGKLGFGTLKLNCNIRTATHIACLVDFAKSARANLFNHLVFFINYDVYLLQWLAACRSQLISCFLCHGC